MNQSFASSLRPKTLNDVIGQDKIMPFLNRMVDKKTKVSLLLYGKPGIGKTSLAYAICEDLKVSYTYFNATKGTKKDLVEVIRMNDYIIIDEIHRLNKDKQDVLLPAIEFGRINVIATTTENPFFVVNPAVRSRLHILELDEIKESDIVKSLTKISEDHNVDIGKYELNYIAKSSGGDYRYCLNIMELLVKMYDGEKIDMKILESITTKNNVYSDKDGDGHYDLLSAFHKSLRGSDINAALYYLGLLVRTGDIAGMERRLLVVAYEDVGFANPNVAMRVSHAVEAFRKLGIEEGRIPLAAAVIDICKADKSNSAYMAINAVEEFIAEGNVYPIPDHIKDSHYSGAVDLGHGQGYKYPHDYGGWVEQQYLPDKIKNAKFFKRNKNDKI